MDVEQVPPSANASSPTFSRRSVIHRGAALLALMAGPFLGRGDGQGLVGLVPWLQQHKDNPTQVQPAESSETD